MEIYYDKTSILRSHLTNFNTILDSSLKCPWDHAYSRELNEKSYKPEASVPPRTPNFTFVYNHILVHYFFLFST